jgi:hypothetical protein
VTAPDVVRHVPHGIISIKKVIPAKEDLRDNKT